MSVAVIQNTKWQNARRDPIFHFNFAKNLVNDSQRGSETLRFRVIQIIGSKVLTHLRTLLPNSKRLSANGGCRSLDTLKDKNVLLAAVGALY